MEMKNFLDKNILKAFTATKPDPTKNARKNTSA